MRPRTPPSRRARGPARRAGPAIGAVVALLIALAGPPAEAADEAPAPPAVPVPSVSAPQPIPAAGDEPPAAAPAPAATEEPPATAEPMNPDAPTARDVMRRILATGGIYFAEAAADLAAARARLAEARAALLPRATAIVEGERYRSTLPSEKDKHESLAGVEVVQPIFDFGLTWNRIDAERSGERAAEDALEEARNTVLLEGLALYYDLHASELTVQSLNEQHASAYVRWERAKEREGLGQRSPVEVAEKVALVEKTRHILYRERSRNADLRLRLGQLTDLPFDKDLIFPPKGPKKKPAEPDVEKLLQRAEADNAGLRALAGKVEVMRERRDGIGNRPRIEAFGAVNQYSRPSRTRDDWTAGARIVWPFFDGGKTSAERSRMAAELGRAEARYELARRDVRRRVQAMIAARSDSWQQVIAARARHEYAEKALFQRQRLYNQERVADLGRAMIDFTAAEAELVRAAGTYRLTSARLAVLLGESPIKGLEDDFVAGLVGKEGISRPASYEPKGGSGFGQEDQDKVNRKAQ